MKTVLSDLGSLIPSSYLTIDSIAYERATNRCVVLASDSSHRYQIVFDDAIAFRMMDEREMHEFWACNIDMALTAHSAALQKVESGGVAGNG